MGYKRSDWIRLVFAHLVPLNSGAPIASANFISDGKVQPTPNGPCPTNGGSVIQDQWVGKIQLLFHSDPLILLFLCLFLSAPCQLISLKTLILTSLHGFSNSGTGVTGGSGTGVAILFHSYTLRSNYSLGCRSDNSSGSWLFKQLTELQLLACSRTLDSAGIPVQRTKIT